MTVYYYYLGYNRNSVLRQGSRTLQVGFVNESTEPPTPASPFFVNEGDEIGFRVVDITPMPPAEHKPMSLSLIFTQADGQAGTPFGPSQDKTVEGSGSVLSGTMFTQYAGPAEFPDPRYFYRSGTVYNVELYDANGVPVTQPIPVYPVPYPKKEDSFIRYAFTAMLMVEKEQFPWTIDPEMEVGTT